MVQSMTSFSTKARISHTVLGRLLIAASMLGAFGCAKARLLGVSGRSGGSSDAVGEGAAGAAPAGAAVQKPRGRSVLVAGHGESLALATPYLGDVDGDGLNDFVANGARVSTADGEYRAYDSLFYGKHDFPERLDTREADAVFEGNGLLGVAPGDINGDGLADMALGFDGGYELVFGDRERLSGLHARFSRGLPWTGPEGEGTSYFMQPLGDVDGDGCAELIVSLTLPASESEIPNRILGRVQTDYLMAGRRGDWPSGQWDPSWAVAQLGDEPPFVFNDGDATLLQRLSFRGGGDFDGDGYADILARGRTSMWVFYGSAEGFRGTLTPTEADAELKWDFRSHEFDLDKTIPFIVGDVDRDGTSDIVLPGDNQIGIVYASDKRWSGTVMLTADLTIAGNDSIWLTSVGDIDADTVPELLLVQSLPTTATGDGPPEIRNAIYLLTAAGEHATGHYQLGDADLYRPGGQELPAEATQSAFNLGFAGDLDGDGSDDLLLGATDQIVDEATSAYGAIYLMPGTPRAPD
jgi:FG-GAP-like repeat